MPPAAPAARYVAPLVLALLLAFALLPPPPAGAATIDRFPDATWQTNGFLDSRGKNLTGRVNAIVYGKGVSAGRVFLAGNFTSVKPSGGGG